MDFVLDISFALQTLRDSLPDAIPVVAFVLGDLLNGAVVFLAGSLILWCVDKKIGMRILLSFAFGYGINQAIKNIACVYRPWLLDSRLHVEPIAKGSATGYSFPSGHTVTITSAAASWAVNRKTRLAVGLAVGLVVLMAFLRVFLGAHTLVDVAAAIVVGLLAVALVQVAMSWVDAKPSRDVVVVLVGAALATLMGAFLIMKPYPLDFMDDGLLIADPKEMMDDVFKALGMVYGALAGWIMERRLGGFSTDGTFAQKAKRFVPGAAFVGIWYVASKPACMAIGLDEPIAEFVKHFGLMLLMAGFYPAVIARFQKRRGAC